MRFVKRGRANGTSVGRVVRMTVGERTSNPPHRRRWVGQRGERKRLVGTAIRQFLCQVKTDSEVIGLHTGRIKYVVVCKVFTQRNKVQPCRCVIQKSGSKSFCRRRYQGIEVNSFVACFIRERERCVIRQEHALRIAFNKTPWIKQYPMTCGIVVCILEDAGL